MPSETVPARSDRMGLRLFLAASLPAFILYASTIAPGVTAEDSGELITSAYTLGIAHPPGYPLWCILGKLFTYLPVGNVAFRVNLLSAALGAIAAGVLALIAYRFTRGFLASLVAALVFAASRDFWSQCVITEVYTLNVLFVLLLVHLVLRYEDTWKRRWLYLAAFTVGLGLTNHSTLGPLSVLFFGWVFLRKPSLLKKPILVANLLASFLLGFALVLYLPMRSAAEPFMNWGNPESLQAFLDHVLRRQYSEASVPRDRTVLGQAVLIWEFTRTYAEQFTPWIGALAALGAIAHARKERATFVLFLLLFGMTSYGFIWLINYPPDRQNLYLTRVFFLPAHAVAAIWIAFALGEIREWAGAMFVVLSGDRRIRHAIAGCAIVLPPLAANHAINDLSADHLAEDWGRSILETLKPNAVIVPSSDHSTFPLIYLQRVEGVRPDVLIADKYGYIEDRVLRDLFRGKEASRVPPPFGGTSAEKQRYMIEQSGRPVYFTTKTRVPGLYSHEFVTSGLVFEAVRKETKPKEEDEKGIWAKVKLRPGSLEHAPGDFAADLVLSDYHFARARFHLLFSRFTEALEEMRLAERHGWGIKEIHNNLGGTMAEAGKPELGIQFIRNALLVDPDYDLALKNLANALFALDRYEEGFPYFERSIEIEPRNPIPWLGKARALKGRLDLMGAYLAYLQASDLDPRNDDLRKELRQYACWAFGEESALARAAAEKPRQPTMPSDGFDEFQPGPPAPAQPLQPTDPPFMGGYPPDLMSYLRN